MLQNCLFDFLIFDFDYMFIFQVLSIFKQCYIYNTYSIQFHYDPLTKLPKTHRILPKSIQNILPPIIRNSHHKKFAKKSKQIEIKK